MNRSLHPIEDGVNLLILRGITLSDIDDVEAWLYAIDMPPNECSEVCREVLSDRDFHACNIEFRLEVCISK